MHYDPKCIKNKHNCSEVCVSVICRIQNPFVCTQCGNGHEAATCKVIPYKKMVKQFHKIQGLYTNEVLKFQQRVENTFSQLMNQLKMNFIKFREQFQYTNITEKIKNIYDKIKSNNENELTGEVVHWAMAAQRRKDIQLKVKSQLQMRLIKQQIVDKFIQVIQALPPYYSLKNVQNIDNDVTVLEDNQMKLISNKFVSKRNVVSGIMDPHFTYVKQMVKKQIYNIHLLYRASQNNFSAQAFHKKCDGMSSTITIAKTEYDKIVIGYCPFPWQSPPRWVYKEDNEQQCMVFSPSKQLRGKLFTVVKPKFAIGMHKDYGPSFGDDFVIYDKAENSKGCWSNFPDVYTWKAKPLQHTVQVVNSFVGVNDHYEKFNLLQWQVYKVSFSKNEDLVMQNSYIREYNKLPQ